MKSLFRGSLSGRVSIKGVPVWGVSYQRVSVWGLYPEGVGVSVQGFSFQEVYVQMDYVQGISVWGSLRQSPHSLVR